MSEPLRVEVAGVPLRCKHCGADVFFQESAAIDRLVGGVFHLEGWWGHQATIYVCSTCGFLHWFFEIGASRHERESIEVMAERDEYFAGGGVEELGPSADIEAMAERVECLACGATIPAGDSACPACGWSWVPGGEKPA
jgi:predicted RNA-binding Zn-ribbon protein involved in translation (DUF1610 family)